MFDLFKKAAEEPDYSKITAKQARKLTLSDVDVINGRIREVASVGGNNLAHEVSGDVEEVVKAMRGRGFEVVVKRKNAINISW